MPRVAFTTFAILKKPYGDPEVQEFDDLTPPTFEEAEGSPGFLARAKEDPGQSHITNFDRDWGEWGKFEVPRFYTGGRTDETDSRASTLSLWADLESVFAFVYSGIHRSTLKPAPRVVPQARVALVRGLVGRRRHHPHLGGRLRPAGAPARPRPHADLLHPPQALRARRHPDEAARPRRAARHGRLTPDRPFHLTPLGESL